MPLVRAHRLINSIEAGTTNGSQLQTLLGDSGRLSEFRGMFDLRANARRVSMSNTAMTAIAASSIAMAAIAAIDEAMAQMAKSAIAKMAFFNSDVALNAIAAAPVAMAALRAASQYSIVQWTENGTNNVTLTLQGTSHIVLGASRGIGSVVSNTIATVRSGSAISGVTPNLAGVSSTQARDFDIAIPISSPRTVRLSAANYGTGYLGILRCDI